MRVLRVRDLRTKRVAVMGPGLILLGLTVLLGVYDLYEWP